MRIGIDLLWVRVGICGGTESYVRNLIDGFVQYDTENTYVLFASQDNAESFRHYEEAENIRMVVCGVKSCKQWKRILWENLFLAGLAKKEGIEKMFIPVYSMPLTWGSKIPYVCVIHDLIPLHFPEYFSLAKRLFQERTWRYACRKAWRVIATTDYTRDDIISHYPFAQGRISTISIPIISNGKSADFQSIADRYHIEKDDYLYCVSSLLPHKNLKTILELVALLKKDSKNPKLVLSGVGGNQEEFTQLLKQYDIEQEVIVTGFVTNEERDCLYENCKVFLYPSIFEGFGMPPIEAMRKGKHVIMTRKTCLEEVTEGKAIYVDNPMDAGEWYRKLVETIYMPNYKEPFPKYELQNVIIEYVKLFERG